MTVAKSGTACVGPPVKRYWVGFLGPRGTVIPVRTYRRAFLQYACPCALVSEPSYFLIFFGGCGDQWEQLKPSYQAVGEHGNRNSYLYKYSM